MQQVILITGASSGFGAMGARALARAGHTVYAAMRHLAEDGGATVAEVERFAREEQLTLRPVALDVTSQIDAETAVAKVLDETGRLDAVIHNAGHMAFGPAEAFTPEQLLQLYDVNAIGAHRVARAALPAMRAAGHGLMLWVGSSSTRGGAPPFLAPYFAAKAGMDALAQGYALELARFGIETTILVPGVFTKGTRHFADTDRPADVRRAEIYRSGPYAGVAEAMLDSVAALEPTDADPEDVARAIVRIVDMPHGRRPFRVHVDPSQDGAEIVDAVADRVRVQLLERIGLADLLHPTA